MAVVELHPERATDQALAFVVLGLRALGERAYAWATLVLFSAMWFCVALVVVPTTPRLIAAVLFSGFLIVLTWKEISDGRAARPQSTDA